ncbi:MAG: Na/Pi cotransporter family protein [Clostridia bacterium]|nr:Na/Pi cotransporter family protein [Clostridia bacterium]
MDIFNVLTMIGGLCLFLFGMNVMGEALERRAGSKLQAVIGRLTSKRILGFLTGLGVTAIIQSSSATTVMVVGFVNSGLMSLRQAVNVIIGANVGTTVTSWVLSLSGISGESIFIRLLKPSSFTPVLALVGVILYMFLKGSKKKDTGLILLGFATLMFGMETMSGAVSGLRDVPAFQQLFVLFSNPFLGVLAGALLTAIIQSSSASVGILQALSSTGQITFGAAIPIIMGQNIGTCVTAMISSVGANKNAKRTAVVHLLFNIIGTVICLVLFTLARALLPIEALLGSSVGAFEIAIVHTVFNVVCTAVLLPASSLLVKLATRLVPDGKGESETFVVRLDERLLSTPRIALEQSRTATVAMAGLAEKSIEEGIAAIFGYSPENAASVRDYEDKTDKYEDVIGTYLVKLSGMRIGDLEGAEAASLLRLIGDFERITDHSVNIVESVEEMRDKGIALSEAATGELTVLCGALKEIVSLSVAAFTQNDLATAKRVEPLEDVIDDLKEALRARHILRLQQGNCSISAGFIWSDLLTNIERTADHCSNIASCILDTAERNLNMHQSVLAQEHTEDYKNMVKEYAEKYALPLEV